MKMFSLTGRIKSLARPDAIPLPSASSDRQKFPSVRGYRCDDSPPSLPLPLSLSLMRDLIP